jgi:hypothetical protein
MTPRHTGFILLYVLAVMVVLSGLALTVAFRERIGIELVHNAVDGVRDEYALRSALALTEAQLELSDKLIPLEQVKDPIAEKADRWRSGNHRAVQIGDSKVSIDLQSQPASPDFNLFDETEITRLFIAMGLPPELSLSYAKIVLAAKPGGPGFADKAALTHIDIIPQAVLGQADAGQAEGSESAMTLAALVDVGSGKKRIDLDHTPLPVIAALSGLSMPKLEDLRKLRQAGPVNEADATTLIGPELKPLLAGSPDMLVRLQLDGTDTWAEARMTHEQNAWKSGPLNLRHGPMEADNMAVTPPAGGQ